MCSRRIGFGTAGSPSFFVWFGWDSEFSPGLRGKMEAGWNRMNGKLLSIWSSTATHSPRPYHHTDFPSS